MRFILTPHTLLRLKQRHIGVSDVKFVVNNDGKTKTGLPAKIRERSVGMTKKGRKLKVVYDVPAQNEESGKIIVITAIWK